MSTHRYPANALLGDYARAGIGIVLTLGPALAVPAGSIGQYILLPLTALFAVFAFRTWWRQISVVELTAQEVAILNPRPQRLNWDQLRDLRLRYYWTKSDRSNGWMQLTLVGDGGKLRIDSALDGFLDVARRAAQAARDNGVKVSQVTATNFGSLGVDLGSPMAAERASPTGTWAGQRHG